MEGATSTVDRRNKPAMSLATIPPTTAGRDGEADGMSSRSVAVSHEPARDSYTSQTTYDEDILNEIPDVDGQCITMDIKEPKSQEISIEPPALPEKSALRASRLLDSLKINSIESARRSLTTSHDAYLSSEEDASSIADDISDYDFDSGSESNTEESEPSPAGRKSREASARAVSVIYIGKPCIVNLTHSRSSSSSSVPSQSSSRATSTHEQSPVPTEPGTPDEFSHGNTQASRSTLALSEKSKPAFLDTDPFANRHYSVDVAREQQQQQQRPQPQPQQEPADEVPRTPRTPTAAVLHRFQKSLSLVRKRSRQNLRAGISRDSLVGPLSASATNLLSIDTSAASLKGYEPQSAITMSMSTPVATPQSPATYTDFMKSRRRSSLASSQFLPSGPVSTPTSTPLTPATNMGPAGTTTTTITTMATPKKGLLGGLNINRRRSVKTKSVTLS